MDEQIKELTKTVMDLRLDLARMDVKMDSIKDVKEKVDAHETKLATLQASTSSAHKRMDKIEKIHAWLLGAVGLGFIGAIVTFVVKGGLVK